MFTSRDRDVISGGKPGPLLLMTLHFAQSHFAFFTGCPNLDVTRCLDLYNSICIYLEQSFWLQNFKQGEMIVIYKYKNEIFFLRICLPAIRNLSIIAAQCLRLPISNSAVNIWLFALIANCTVTVTFRHTVSVSRYPILHLPSRCSLSVQLYCYCYFQTFWTHSVSNVLT